MLSANFFDETWMLTESNSVFVCLFVDCPQANNEMHKTATTIIKFLFDFIALAVLLIAGFIVSFSILY